jgi:hypothetical protein
LRAAQPRDVPATSPLDGGVFGRLDVGVRPKLNPELEAAGLLREVPSHVLAQVVIPSRCPLVRPATLHGFAVNCMAYSPSKYGEMDQCCSSNGL